jgi:hypothetical protein
MLLGAAHGTLCRISIDGLHVSGVVLSAVLVLGGNYKINPPLTSTSLEGSVLGDITVVDSTYASPVVLTMSEFTGSVDVSTLPEFSRVLILPDVGGTLSYGTARLDIINPSQATNIFGMPYETEFDAGTDLYGYTRADIDAEQSYAITWLGSAILFLLVFGIVTNENVAYLVAITKKSQEHDDDDDDDAGEYDDWN